jgi:hypothetical protein
VFLGPFESKQLAITGMNGLIEFNKGTKNDDGRSFGPNLK